MKPCFKCSRMLPLSEFYRNSHMGDGYLNKCKTCALKDSREHRLRNLEERRAYGRKWARERRSKDAIRRAVSGFKARYPERRKAHEALNNAVRDGRIHKSSLCQRCGVAGRIEAHHWDYSKPLVVEWLCKPCHAKADQERRAA